MKKNKLIDGIIKEPEEEHTFPEEIFKTVKKEIIKYTKALEKKSSEERIIEHIEKFGKMGEAKSNEKIQAKRGCH